jgi:hypothetical protein
VEPSLYYKWGEDACKIGLATTALQNFEVSYK